MDILFPLYIKSYPIVSIMEQLVAYHSQILGEWWLELQLKTGYQAPHHSSTLAASFVTLHLTPTLTCSSRSASESIPFSSFSFMFSVF